MGTRNLVLIGFMGTGKSTVGAHCAQLLGYEFCDTDVIIAQRAGLSIPQIFEREGEGGFRARERDVVAELATGGSRVIATGGGAILDPENASRLRSSGCVVGLRARPDTILRRVGEAASRPLLASATDPATEIQMLLASRSPSYEKHAQHFFDTDSISPVQLASEIVERYRESRGAIARIELEVPGRSYPILIEAGMIASGLVAQKIVELAPCERACIVTHPGLCEPYAAPIEAGLRGRGIAVSTVQIPPGERHKTLKTVTRLYAAFLDARLDRKGVVIVVGGGVLGDIAGFAAATFLRGIRVVQVPTTLLAQVDSSIGGKTGVDLPAGKNLIGAFHQPTLVVIDPSTLQTLAARELRSGLAEVVKYGIIYDSAFFAEVARSLPRLLRRVGPPLVHSILRSVEIKAEVVSQDETEQGLRAILNFGHTVGHALESATHYRRYKHGEAISIGMVSAALIGEQLGVTPRAVTRNICQVLSEARLPVTFPEDVNIDLILDGAQRDKKTEGGRLRFVLARSLGEVYVQDDVPAGAIVEALTRQQRGELAHA